MLLKFIFRRPSQPNLIYLLLLISWVWYNLRFARILWILFDTTKKRLFVIRLIFYLIIVLPCRMNSYFNNLKQYFRPIDLSIWFWQITGQQLSWTPIHMKQWIILRFRQRKWDMMKDFSREIQLGNSPPLCKPSCKLLWNYHLRVDWSMKIWKNSTRTLIKKILWCIMLFSARSQAKNEREDQMLPTQQ